MYSSPNSSLNLRRRLVLILGLVTLAVSNLSSLQVGGQTQPGRPRRATAESSATPQAPQPSRNPQPPGVLDEGDNQDIRKENDNVLFAFIVIQDFLPTGAHVTSGFRDRDDQVALIGRMASSRGFKTPAVMSYDKPETWRPALMFLRGKGLIVASPDATPHQSTKFTVFDLAGADLYAISEGCKRAAANGLISLRRDPLIETVNNGVHVELKLKEKAFYVHGLRKPVAWTLVSDSNASGASNSNAPEANPTPPAEDWQALISKKRADHEASTNPLRQIDYDNELIELYTRSTNDAATVYPIIKDLEEDIEKHKAEAASRVQSDRKTEMEDAISAALQDGRLEDAERLAKKYVDANPDDPKAKASSNNVKTRLLVDEAIDTLIKGECGECEKAGQTIDAALALSPSDPGAQRIKEEVSACLAGCRTRRTAIIILVVLFAAGTIVGLFFLVGPKKWVLEGVYGPCKGEVFPLNKQKMKIGAVDSPEDEIDVVISDANHKISRLHCSLRQDGRRWYLKDKSSNGTKINDVKMDKDRYVKLRNGDEISLADEAMLLFRPK